MVSTLQTASQRKHEVYVHTVATKLHKAETDAIDKNKREWASLNKKMTATYTQSVSTNVIAIKNNKVLTKNLTSALDITSVNESIAIQQSTICSIQTNLDTTDN